MNIPQIEELDLLHANICQALGDPKRIQILFALHGEPRYVSALADDLGMPQPTVSRHLQVLSQRTLVQKERDGQTVVDSLTESRIIEVLNTMRQILRDALERQANVLA